MDEVSRRNLEALCREIAVTKQVLRFYGPNWNKPDERELLPTAWWPLLAAVFLAYGSDVDHADEDTRAVALKNLNAGLMTLDIIENMLDVAQLSALRAQSCDILERIWCEGRR